MLITTNRLLIRNPELQDRDDLFRYRSLPEVYRYQDDFIFAMLNEEWTERIQEATCKKMN